MSETRSEIFARPPPRRDVRVVAPTSFPAFLRPEYRKYMQHRRWEVVPGLQNDGRITEKHPYVDVFLAGTEFQRILRRISVRRRLRIATWSQ